MKRLMNIVTPAQLLPIEIPSASGALCTSTVVRYALCVSPTRFAANRTGTAWQCPARPGAARHGPARPALPVTLPGGACACTRLGAWGCLGVPSLPGSAWQVARRSPARPAEHCRGPLAGVRGGPPHERLFK